MVFEYASLKGTLDGMDPTVITEIANYFRDEMDYDIPPMTPFVGDDFNATRAGIHADGLLKNEEIYNIFNTEKLLNRPTKVNISSTSGLAGISYWINNVHRLKGDMRLSKQDPLVAYVKDWVDAQFAMGRQTFISDNEIDSLILKFSEGKEDNESYKLLCKKIHKYSDL